jgi:hypothetical protein
MTMQEDEGTMGKGACNLFSIMFEELFVGKGVEEALETGDQGPHL